MAESSSLHNLLASQGAFFENEAGGRMPAHFGEPAAENHYARAGAALFDLAHRGKVEATGKDAAAFLHNLSTNDVKSLPVGAACEAFLTTGQAKIVAYLLIERLQPAGGSDVFWLDSDPGTAEAVVKHLDRFIISEQVELMDHSGDFAEFHLAGPNAAVVLGQVAREALPLLPELQHCSAVLGTAPARVRRHDALTVPGFDILCRQEQAEAVWRALTEAGARPAGRMAHNVLRVEAGLPIYGVDIDETHLPQEIGRTERTVSFTKGCYIGQETIARIRTYGHVNRAVVGLKFTGDSPAPAGAKLFHDGKEVGHVTSSVVSPRLGSAIALAYVRRGSQEPGTALEVEMEGKRCRAEVVTLPFLGETL